MLLFKMVNIVKKMLSIIINGILRTHKRQLVFIFLFFNGFILLRLNTNSMKYDDFKYDDEKHVINSKVQINAKILTNQKVIKILKN